jgi:acetyltransferase-like isoleucine patch superfamily enzyme
MIHHTAIVESDAIGSGTRIWAFAHVLPGACIGENCNLGDCVFVESGAVVGSNVTLKNHVCVWEGIIIEDDVFVGPHVSFVNDRYPRSARMKAAQKRYANKDEWLVATILERGCSIGANATILGGVRLGRYCLIAAGATVTKDVAPFALMAGSPARRMGTVCVCGQKLPEPLTRLGCSACGDFVDECCPQPVTEMES